MKRVTAASVNVTLVARDLEFNRHQVTKESTLRTSKENVPYRWRGKRTAGDIRSEVRGRDRLKTPADKFSQTEFEARVLFADPLENRARTNRNLLHVRLYSAPNLNRLADVSLLRNLKTSPSYYVIQRNVHNYRYALSLIILIRNVCVCVFFFFKDLNT